MKYFISQAMHGRTYDAIRAERDKVITAIKKQNPEAEVIDSFLKDAPYDAKPLWFLGKSFELLSTADVCVFVDYAYIRTRGCWLEYNACITYGIDFCDFDVETGEFLADPAGI